MTENQCMISIFFLKIVVIFGNSKDYSMQCKNVKLKFLCAFVLTG